MTDDDARKIVLQCLAEVAPEADLDALEGNAELAQTLDLDSMDMFDLVAAISERSAVEIPERDVGSLQTLDAIAGYLVVQSAGTR